jgi:hypothetical protein
VSQYNDVLVLYVDTNMLWRGNSICSCIYVRCSLLNSIFGVSCYLVWSWNSILNVQLWISVQVSFMFGAYGISLNCLCVFLYYTIYSVQQFNTWYMLRHQLFLFYSFVSRWSNWYAAIRIIFFCFCYLFIFMVLCYVVILMSISCWYCFSFIWFHVNN